MDARPSYPAQGTYVTAQVQAHTPVFSTFRPQPSPDVDQLLTRRLPRGQSLQMEPGNRAKVLRPESSAEIASDGCDASVPSVVAGKPAAQAGLLQTRPRQKLLSLPSRPPLQPRHHTYRPVSLPRPRKRVGEGELGLLIKGTSIFNDWGTN